MRFLRFGVGVVACLPLWCGGADLASATRNDNATSDPTTAVVDRCYGQLNEVVGDGTTTHDETRCAVGGGTLADLAVRVRCVTTHRDNDDGGWSDLAAFSDDRASFCVPAACSESRVADWLGRVYEEHRGADAACVARVNYRYRYPDCVADIRATSALHDDHELWAWCDARRGRKAILTTHSACRAGHDDDDVVVRATTSLPFCVAGCHEAAIGEMVSSSDTVLAARANCDYDTRLAYLSVCEEDLYDLLFLHDDLFGVEENYDHNHTHHTQEKHSEVSTNYFDAMDDWCARTNGTKQSLSLHRTCDDTTTNRTLTVPTCLPASCVVGDAVTDFVARYFARHDPGCAYAVRFGPRLQAVGTIDTTTNDTRKEPMSLHRNDTATQHRRKNSRDDDPVTSGATGAFLGLAASSVLVVLGAVAVRERRKLQYRRAAAVGRTTALDLNFDHLQLT